MTSWAATKSALLRAKSHTQCVRMAAACCEKAMPEADLCNVAVAYASHTVCNATLLERCAQTALSSTDGHAASSLALCVALGRTKAADIVPHLHSVNAQPRIFKTTAAFVDFTWGCVYCGLPQGRHHGPGCTVKPDTVWLLKTHTLARLAWCCAKTKAPNGFVSTLFEEVQGRKLLCAAPLDVVMLAWAASVYGVPRSADVLRLCEAAACVWHGRSTKAGRRLPTYASQNDYLPVHLLPAYYAAVLNAAVEVSQYPERLLTHLWKLACAVEAFFAKWKPQHILAVVAACAQGACKTPHPVLSCIEDSLHARDSFPTAIAKKVSDSWVAAQGALPPELSRVLCASLSSGRYPGTKAKPTYTALGPRTTIPHPDPLTPFALR